MTFVFLSYVAHLNSILPFVMACIWNGFATIIPTKLSQQINQKILPNIIWLLNMVLLSAQIQISKLFSQTSVFSSLRDLCMFINIPFICFSWLFIMRWNSVVFDMDTSHNPWSSLDKLLLNYF